MNTLSKIKSNPFRFGTVVEGTFFTNRENELQMVIDIISGENHLVLISPRRFGKTSLVNKAIQQTKRPYIAIDLQSITSVLDFSIQLLRKVLKQYPYERIKHFIKRFKIIPTLSLNPQTNSIDISFQSGTESLDALSDVFQLIENIGEKGIKPIVFFDEFQEIVNIDKNLDKQLRSIIQYHKSVNYIFIGSYEGMMRDIFEKKKSPFYHFGHLLTLKKISYNDFYTFLNDRFKGFHKESELIAKQILSFSHCHPYYTQQLAWQVWNIIEHGSDAEIQKAVKNLIEMHDNDYERIWNSFGQTDRKILIGLTRKNISVLDKSTLELFGLSATSTAFSSLKRLLRQGYIIREKGYEFDDPFFREWIISMRELC